MVEINSTVLANVFISITLHEPSKLAGMFTCVKLMINNIMFMDDAQTCNNYLHAFRVNCKSNHNIEVNLLL